jgi:hypothetical protein
MARPTSKCATRVIEIRAVRCNARESWADDARRLAAQGDDKFVW